VDVLVVGGGPAGAAAALTALRGGAQVRIVERSRFPRYRPGETLHPGIEPLLAKLGVADILDSVAMRHAGIWSAWAEPMRFFPYGEDARGPWHGFQATGSAFDQHLLERACVAGAALTVDEVIDVLSGADGSVRGVRTAHGHELAGWVIDCTGRRHLLARHLGIGLDRHSPQLVASYGYATGDLDATLPAIWSDPEGWTWVAEVAPSRYHWTRVTEASHRPAPGWMPAALRTLTREFTRGADVSWRIARRLAGPGFCLAGDSAMVLDPSSSHGVLRAIMSGMMAAHLVLQIAGGADPARCAARYHAWLSAWFRADAIEMAGLYRRANLFGFGPPAAD